MLKVQNSFSLVSCTLYIYISEYFLALRDFRNIRAINNFSHKYISFIIYLQFWNGNRSQFHLIINDLCIRNIFINDKQNNISLQHRNMRDRCVLMIRKQYARQVPFSSSIQVLLNNPIYFIFDQKKKTYCQNGTGDHEMIEIFTSDFRMILIKYLRKRK